MELHFKAGEIEFQVSISDEDGKKFLNPEIEGEPIELIQFE